MVKPVPEVGRRGEPTVRIGDRFLHSPYSPRTEVRRFLDGTHIHRDTHTLLVIGDGLGLIAAELIARRPELRVLSIEPADTTDGLERRYCATTTDRLPAAAMDASSIRRALREMLHPGDIGGVQLLVWPGIDRCAPEWRAEVEGGIRDALRDLRSELATIAHFGRLWITNGIRVTLGADRRSEVTLRGDTVYLAASGPTVSTLPGGVRPLAVSSALFALRRRAIKPLLVLHTDAGAWGRRYLQDCDESADTVPALPLRAGRAPGEAPLLLADGSLVDQLAPDATTWLRLPDQPSVGASLIDLARRLGPVSDIRCAGLDLCSYDLVLHGRPHRNDLFMTARAHRVSSDTTQRFMRVLPNTPSMRWDDGARAYLSDALEAFTAPIGSLLEAERDRPVRPLRASPVWESLGQPGYRDRPSFRPGPPARLERHTITRPGREVRLRHLVTTIADWHDRIASGDIDGRSRRDLLLYLAPVEYLADRRDGSDRAAAAAGDTLRRIARKAGLP